MKSSQKGKTIIALYDDTIQYITLAKDKDGFYIQNYDSAKLEMGIIKNGEVLKADFLRKVIHKIVKKLEIKSIDLIVDHKYFLFDTYQIETLGKKNKKKVIKKYLKENSKKIPWAQTHVYEYDSFEKEGKINLLLRALPKQMYSSYEHVFKKSGLKINSIHSHLVSYAHLLPQNERISQIFVDKNQTFLLEYKFGIYTSDKKFNLSYRQLIKDIQKNINLSADEAYKILNKYGVLKTHPDTKVLARVERSMNPLFDFLRKRKIKEKSSIYIHFSDTPIKGFSNRIKRLVKTDIHDICPLLNKKYVFHEVLSLHKKDSYQYEPLIARGLSIFEKK